MVNVFNHIQVLHITSDVLQTVTREVHARVSRSTNENCKMEKSEEMVVKIMNDLGNCYWLYFVGEI